MIKDSINIREVEISGEALSSFLNGFPEYLTDIALTILLTHDIETPEPGKWYNMNKYLKALNEIGSKYGGDTLYAIGKESIKTALLPTNVKDFKDAISKLEEAFELNHRNLDICWVTIEKLDLSDKRVELCMENPYPYEINRGILTALSRQYNPFESLIPEVNIDEGGCILSKGRYIITW